MSEIGSGSGSSYPGSLDTNNTVEVNSPNAGKTKARAEVPNDLAACIVAIETELGTDPAGSLTNVKTFLQTEHSASGTHTTDSIAEKTAAAGVTVDGVLLKDSQVTTDVVNEKTATAGVTIDSCLIKDGGAAALSDGTNIIKMKIIDIGDWDMNATAQVTVAHGLTMSKIRYVSALIRQDDDAVFYPLAGLGADNDGDCNVTSTNIVLNRSLSSTFDSTSFDSTSFNRGWITIIYIA